MPSADGNGFDAPKPFILGSADLTAWATVSNGSNSSNLFSPQMYIWNTTGDGSSYVPESPTPLPAEMPLYDLNVSTPHKTAQFNLGEVPDDVPNVTTFLKSFPKTTSVTVNITQGTSDTPMQPVIGAPLLPRNLKIRWSLPDYLLINVRTYIFRKNGLTPLLQDDEVAQIDRQIKAILHADHQFLYIGSRAVVTGSVVVVTAAILIPAAAVSGGAALSALPAATKMNAATQRALLALGVTAGGYYLLTQTGDGITFPCILNLLLRLN